MARRLPVVINALAVVVLALATVASWSREPVRADALAAAAPGSGLALFHSKGCAACHSGPDSSSPFGTGPPLIDVRSRVAGMSRADYVRQSISLPQAFIAPNTTNGSVAMPTLNISRPELTALVDYLTGEG